MKKQIPLNAVIKLIGFYSLILGIIGTILIVGFAVTQKHPAPTPTITIIPTDTLSPTNTTSNGEQVFCTMEAKQCPDGSFVGREGPNCEFAKCPGE